MNVDGYIDIDLSIAPPGRGKGLIEMSESELEVFGASMKTLQAAVGPGVMLPRARWKDKALERMANRQRRDDSTFTEDQGAPSSCTGMAAAKAAEVTRRRRFGLQYEVRFSGLGLYTQIRGVTRDSGATIKQAMDVLCNVGPLPLDTPENKARFGAHTYPMNAWGHPLPAGFQSTADLFRGDKFAVVHGLDEIYSAAAQDFCVLVGRDRHCICYYDIAWSQRYDEPFLVLKNSYGPGWGENGDGYDSKRIVENLTGYVLLGVALSPDLPIPSLG